MRQHQAVTDKGRSRRRVSILSLLAACCDILRNAVFRCLSQYFHLCHCTINSACAELRLLILHTSRCSYPKILHEFHCFLAPLEVWRYLALLPPLKMGTVLEGACATRNCALLEPKAQQVDNARYQYVKSYRQKRKSCLSHAYGASPHSAAVLKNHA